MKTYMLHLSDLHFVKNAAAFNTEEIILREAEEKVKDVPQGNKLLVVTGDFHNFPDEDYSKAESFLKKLVDKMGLIMEQDVFVIPGNHDVANDAALKPFLEPIDPLWKSHNKSALTMLKRGDKSYLLERLRVFRPYCTFVRRLGIYDSSHGEDYPAQTHVRCWRGRLNFLHLNTALIADGKSKKNQQTDADSAANPDTWKDYYNKDIPSIALGHNSYYDLKQNQRKDLAGTFALRNISVYLCGDRHRTEHDTEQNNITIAGGHKNEKRIPNMVAAKGIADGDDAYSEVGFGWHIWDEDTDDVSVELRKWTHDALGETVSGGDVDGYEMRRVKSDVSTAKKASAIDAVAETLSQPKVGIASAQDPKPRSIPPVEERVDSSPDISNHGNPKKKAGRIYVILLCFLVVVIVTGPLLKKLMQNTQGPSGLEKDTQTMEATPSEVLIDATPKETTQTTPQPEQHPAPEEIPVISVIGNSATDALSALIGQGFKVNLAYSYSENIATGNVISQYPSAGSLLEKGASVTITISNGPEMISVTNVVGQSLSEANTNLTDQGFYVVSSEEFSSLPSGEVMRQSPSAGSLLEKGGTVSVVISKGKQPVIVSFNSTGGAVSLLSKTVYVSDPYGEMPTPTRTGFNFIGWYSATSGGTKVDENSTVSIASNHTLYAHWEEDIPRYLSYYIAPSSLGSDLHKPIVSIEGDLYQFPCPVRAFLNNGWTGDDLDDIADPAYSYGLTLTRNGKTIHFGNVNNPLAESTTFRNCVVEGIIVDDDWNDSINIFLPNNITLGSSREFVMSVLPSDFKKVTDIYGRVDYMYTLSKYIENTTIIMDQTNSYVVGLIENTTIIMDQTNSYVVGLSVTRFYN